MELLPIFPLPNAVLFPNVFLPLHIFEPRYRAMVADALEGDRLMGMVLLQPGWKHDYEGYPPIFQIGCLGVITHAARLDDGRFNIVLRGVQRIRIIEEDHGRAYRRATYEALGDRSLTPEERRDLAGMRNRLEGLLASAVDFASPRGTPAGATRGAPPQSTAGMNDEELVNALAQYLDFDPLEKLALLEQDCLQSRARALVELIEMKLIVARGHGYRGTEH